MKPSARTPLLALTLLLSACTVAPVASSSPNTSSPNASSPPPAPSASAYPFTLDTFPALDGSTANIPLASLLLQRLAGVPKAQADNITFSTTPEAYMNLACGAGAAPDLVVLAYEPAEETKDQIKPGVAGSDCGKLEYHAIGRDALVFLTNDKNKVTSLTTDQYKKVYTGAITNWSKLGGSDEKIVAYQRPESSGSQALMRKFVMGKTAMAKAPQDLVSAEMSGLIDDVASYNNQGNALGYSVYYYAKEMYATPGIKLLGADGVQPSSDTIADGSYPYVNDFYAVIRADEPKNSAARKVVAWLESADGQQTVVDAGYVGKK